MRMRLPCHALVASTVVAAALAFGGAANATPLPATFNITGVFDDGGTLGGTFGISEYGYNDHFSTVFTTLGTTLTIGQVYTLPPADPQIVPNDPLSATSLQWVDNTQTPYRTLHIAFFQAINEVVQVGPPNNPSTFLPLAIDLANSYECFSWNCPGPTGVGGNTRYLISGAITSAEEVAPPAVPIPGALPLFAGGLGVLGLAGWRRRKRAATNA